MCIIVAASNSCTVFERTVSETSDLVTFSLLIWLLYAMNDQLLDVRMSSFVSVSSSP